MPGRSCRTSGNGVQDLAKFRPATLASVARLASPVVAAHASPLATLKSIAAKWQFKAYVRNPHTTEKQLAATLIGVILLTMMGFLVLENGRIVLAQYGTFSENFVRAGNRLMQWGSSVSLEEVRALIPNGEADTVRIDQAVADSLCLGVKALLAGEDVNLQQLQHLEASHSREIANGTISPTQLGAAPAAESGAADKRSHTGSIGDSGLAQTQSSRAALGEEVDGREGARQRLRAEPALAAADVEIGAGSESPCHDIVLEVGPGNVPGLNTRMPSHSTGRAQRLRMPCDSSSACWCPRDWPCSRAGHSQPQ